MPYADEARALSSLFLSRAKSFSSSEYVSQGSSSNESLDRFEAVKNYSEQGLHGIFRAQPRFSVNNFVQLHFFDRGYSIRSFKEIADLLGFVGGQTTAEAHMGYEYFPLIAAKSRRRSQVVALSAIGSP